VSSQNSKRIRRCRTRAIKRMTRARDFFMGAKASVEWRDIPQFIQKMGLRELEQAGVSFELRRK
jgi:uncharacterized protein YPO0396